MIPGLFNSIKRILKPGGKLLIANEHYVTSGWVATRIVSYFAHFTDKKRYYNLFTLRSPHPFDGEHWRTREELEEIFRNNGFRGEIKLYRGDLCKDKPTFYRRIGWRYYYVLLNMEERA